MSAPDEKQRVRFDYTITLGNVLTLAAMAVACGAAWTNMSERVSRVEQIQSVLRESDLRHEAELRVIKSDNRETLLEIKTDIKEMRNEMRRK